MPHPVLVVSFLTATNFLFSFFFDFFLKEFSSIFAPEGGVPPPVWGRWFFFFFFVFFFSGRGLPPVGFGGRGGFVSRLGAGGGEDDRLSGTLTGERGPASTLPSVSY